MKSVENWHAVSEKKTYKNILFYTYSKLRRWGVGVKEGEGQKRISRGDKYLITTDMFYYFKLTL